MQFDIILAWYLESPNLNKNGQAVFILQVHYNFHELCDENFDPMKVHKFDTIFR